MDGARRAFARVYGVLSGGQAAAVAAAAEDGKAAPSLQRGVPLLITHGPLEDGSLPSFDIDCLAAMASLLPLCVQQQALWRRV